MGAGYDISASASNASAQTAEATAPTIINFGDKSSVDGGWYSQTSSQNPTAVAARTAGNTADGASSSTGGGIPVAGNKLLLYGGIALAVVAAGVGIYLLVKHHK